MKRKNIFIILIILVAGSSLIQAQRIFRPIDPNASSDFERRYGKSAYSNPPFLYFGSTSYNYKIADSKYNSHLSYVDAAFASWNNAAPVQFSRTSTGLALTAQAQNYSSWGPAWSFPIWNGSTYELTPESGSIVLNSSSNVEWSDFEQHLNASPHVLDVQSMVVHEAGHIHGLAHPLTTSYTHNASAPTMAGGDNSYFDNTLDVRSLETEDIYGTQFLQLRVPTLYSNLQTALNKAAAIGTGYVYIMSNYTLSYNTTVASGVNLIIKSGVTLNLNGYELILTGGTIEGENESTVAINGDITFNNASYAALRKVTVSGIIEVNSGYNNTINNVTTDERILWNSSNNGYISSVTANHSDKYGLKIYNSSDVAINNFNTSSSSKYGVYGSSSSILTMEYSSLEEKTFAIQITSGSSASIYYINFDDNDYDVWESGDGDGVGYYFCFWSDYPESLYVNVYPIPHPSQSSSSNLAKIETNGQSINKTADNIYSNISDDADFNEALNIFRMIKDKKRLARENEEKFEPSDYLADYNNAIDKFKKVVKKLNSEKLAISSQLYLYFLYLDIQQHSEFIRYLESVINNCENENLKHRSMILLAYTQLREDEYKTAIEYIDNVIQEADDEDILASSLYDNGMILKYFLKDENEAKKYFSTLVESYPKNILADHASDELEDRSVEDNTEKKELVSQIEISNYPNPFNPTTQISYQIPKDGLVNLVVYNTLGQKVETLVSKQQTSGKYSVQFNASDLPSGVYFYKLQAGEFSKVNKMLLVR